MIDRIEKLSYVALQEPYRLSIVPREPPRAPLQTFYRDVQAFLFPRGIRIKNEAPLKAGCEYAEYRMMKHAVPYCRFGDRALFRVVYEKSAILLMPIPALDKLSVEIDELLFSVLGKNQDIALPQLARAKLAPCGDEIFERYYPIEYMTTKYPPPTIFPSLLSFIRFPDYIAQYMNGSLGFRKHLGIRLVRTLRKACLRY